MPKALVLGGETGMLGKALMNALAVASWEAASLGRADGDIFDPGFLDQKIAALAPDAVFNAIAWTQVDDAQDHADQADAINRVFPINLSRSISRLPAARLYHFSTDFVFTGNTGVPWKEADEPSPSSVYGSTKLAGEKAVLEILPERGCVLRTAWLFGPGKKNFISTILGLCRQRDSINVVDDQIGSPTYTVDLAAWSVILADKGQCGMWHAVNSGMASWYELANEACHLAGLACRVCPIPSSEWPQKAPRPAFSVLDNHKLTAFLGKQPRSWPQALRDYIFSEFCEPGREVHD